MDQTMVTGVNEIGVGVFLCVMLMLVNAYLALRLVQRQAPPRQSGAKPVILTYRTATAAPRRSTAAVAPPPATTHRSRPGARLILMAEDRENARAVFPLVGHRQRVGRGPRADIRLADDTVSFCHATLWLQDGRYYIQDEGSHNGVLVNGRRITRQSLAPHDIIRLGGIRLRFIG